MPTVVASLPPTDRRGRRELTEVGRYALESVSSARISPESCKKGNQAMKQLTLGVLSAFALAVIFVTTVLAESHPATGTTTAGTTGGATVTAVPQTGVGAIATYSTEALFFLFVALAALMLFASRWQSRRA